MSLNKKILSFIGIILIICLTVVGREAYIKSHAKIVAIEAIMPPVNFANASEFVGAADDVFIGKVNGQIGNEGRRNHPETQFEVEVILTIKGKLEGIVSVNQIGGYKDGKLIVLSEADKADEYLLKSDSTYLFATRGEKHTLTFWPYAAELLSSDSSLSKEDILKLVQDNKKIQGYILAYPNEVIMEADILHNRMPNSFKSLPVEEQNRIRAEVGAMIQAESTPAPTTE